MFNIDRYVYLVHKNRITACTNYHGKLVTSVAKCDPSDTFDFDAGKKLAAYRLNLKIAEMRCKDLDNKYTMAYEEANKLCAHLTDAKMEKSESLNALASLEYLFKE